MIALKEARLEEAKLREARLRSPSSPSRHDEADASAGDAADEHPTEPPMLRRMSSSLVNVEVAGQNTRPLGRLQPEGRTHYRPAPSTRFGARSHFPGADRLRGGLLPSGIPTSLVQWWHAGSITKRAMARQATLAREQWVGTGIPCPRLVTIAAMGGAMLELSLTCSPSIGCTASGSATAAGACSSVGRASADIVDKTVRGNVGYSSYSHTVVVDGDFGFAIADDSVGIDGKISKKVDWKLDGPGSVSGTAAYVVTPDRSYCAFTNRPIDFRSNGWAIASGAMSVDENGSTSMSALAIVGLSVR